MFLLINNEDLHKVNKRIIFNITNDGDVNLLMAKVKNGDVVELELTELATNTLHYVLASYKTFIKDVPYSFEFSPYLGVNTLSGTKNIVDFKLNKTSLEMATISLNDAYVSTSDSKINLTDISGKTFDLKTKGGSVVFYNDSEVSKASGLVLTFDGSQTMQDIDENIKRG